MKHKKELFTVKKHFMTCVFVYLDSGYKLTHVKDCFFLEKIATFLRRCKVVQYQLGTLHFKFRNNTKIIKSDNTPRYKIIILQYKKLNPYYTDQSIIALFHYRTIHIALIYTITWILKEVMQNVKVPNHYISIQKVKRRFYYKFLM